MAKPTRPSSPWSSLASLHAWLVAPRVTAEENAAFAEHTRELTARLWPGLGLVLVLAALLWWPVDYLVYPASPTAREAFAEFRAAIVVLDSGFALLLPRLAVARRHAHVAATLAALANLLLSGWFLAEAGQGAAIWLYYAFITPFLSVLLFVPLRARLVIVAAFTASLVATWIAHPQTRLDTPGTTAGFSYLVYCAGLSAFIGHLLYVQVCRSFHLGRRVERQRLELAGLAAHLEERVRAQTAALRELGSRAQAARAEQRLEIARELHDSLGQELTSMRLLVDLGSRLEGDAADTFSELAAQIQRIQGSLRQVLLSLRPQPLEEGALLESLAILVGEFGRRSGLTCLFRHSGRVDGLAPELSLALYRVAQEGLTNAIRHARARNVEVNLRGGADEVTLELRDDGGGIDPERVGAGFGTRGIQERACALGGLATWTVDRGTRLVVTLPRRRST